MAGKIIDIPGQGPVEFPESMTDHEIEAVLQRQFSPKDSSPTTGETVLGHPATRFAMGLASPFMGAAQLGANIGDWINSKIDPLLPPSLRSNPQYAVGKLVNEQMAELEGMKKRGMEKLGHGTTDIAGLLGNLASAVPTLGSGAAVRVPGLGSVAIPQATTTLGRLGVGAGQGALAGAVAPVVSGDKEYAGEKLEQIGTGSVLGAGTAGAIDTVRAIGQNIILPVTNLFRGDTGVENIAREGYRKIIGEKNIPAVKDALLHARQLVAGSKPTAGQAVAHIPEGSPVQALERITAKTPGGPSAEFGERVMKQGAAREIAKDARNALTEDLRTNALELANRGKVEARDVLDGIVPILSKPGLRSDDLVTKTLDRIREKITEHTKADGSIDANDLYTIRKKIGNTIKVFAKETQTWDKNLTAGIQSDIQKGIDWAMNNAIARAQNGPALTTGNAQRLLPGVSTPGGKTIWDQYLSDYSSRSQAIKDDIARALLAKHPAQPTTLTKLTNIAEGTMPHVALLSRPVVIANAALKHIAGNIEPKVDALNTQLMLNPQRLGNFLDQPVSRYRPILDAMLSQIQQAPLYSSVMATRQ